MAVAGAASGPAVFTIELGKPRHRSSNKARSVRHDPAAQTGEVRRREASRGRKNAREVGMAVPTTPRSQIGIVTA